MLSSELNTQSIGGFLQYMVIGSSLNWIIFEPYLYKHIGNNLLDQNYLILYLNLGLLLKLFLNKCIPERRRIIVRLCGLLLYSISVASIAYCDKMISFMQVMPPIYMGILGFIALDPMQQLIKNDFIDQEKHICFLLSGLCFGWVFFAAIITLLWNPHLELINQTFTFNLDFKIGCFLYGLITALISIIGVAMNMPKIRTELVDELELTKNKFEYSDYIQKDTLRLYLKPIRHLTNIRFYILIIQLYLIYSPAIGTFDYILVKGQELYYFYLVINLSIFLGIYTPLLFRMPYSIKPIFGIIQIFMMLLISFMGIVYNNFILELICIGLMFFLFGIMLSFAVLLLQSIFETIIETIPLAFISISLSILTQQLLFNHWTFYRGVLIVEYIFVAIGFLLNLFLTKKY